jgi:hypothetical protein
MFGWIFRRRATASATALFGPWPYSSIFRRSLCPLPHCHRSGLRLRMGRSSSSSNRRGSSSPSVVATGTELDLLHLLRLGMGRAQSNIAFFTPTTVSSRWRLRRCWTGTWRWRRGKWSQLPKGEVVLAIGLVLYGGGLFRANTQHKQSVTSTSSRSCRPWRWWAQVTASQRFLAPRPIGKTAGGNGDGGIQLRLDSGDASSSAGERLVAATAGRHRLVTAMGFKFV